MELQDLKEWFSTGKVAIDLFNAAAALLPKGAKRDQIEATVKQAEVALQKSDAALAMKLGYLICRCAFPPTPMLWNKDERASICPKCGDRRPRDEPPRDPDEGYSWIKAREGRR